MQTSPSNAKGKVLAGKTGSRGTLRHLTLPWSLLFSELFEEFPSSPKWRSYPKRRAGNFSPNLRLSLRPLRKGRGEVKVRPGVIPRPPPLGGAFPPYFPPSRFTAVRSRGGRHGVVTPLRGGLPGRKGRGLSGDACAVGAARVEAEAVEKREAAAAEAAARGGGRGGAREC